MIKILIINSDGKAEKINYFQFLQKVLYVPLQVTKYIMNKDTWEDIVKWREEDKK